MPYTGDYPEQTTSGLYIDRDKAMTHGVVHKCVQLVGNYVGKTPFRVMTTTGTPEVDTSHPAHRLLRRRANAMMSALQFRKTLTFHVLLHGNGYAWIVRDRMGRPKELIPLLPDRTGLTKHEGRLTYFTQVDTEFRRILPRNVFHIRGLSFDGLTGLSVIEYMAESMGLSIAARTFGSTFFSNGATPSGFASIPEGLDNDRLEEFRTNFEKGYTTLGRAHRVMLLEEGITFQSNAIPQDQAQFLETRKYQDTVMLPNWFGVPSHRVGGDIKSSYNSLEQENQAFIDDGIDPHLCNWEFESNMKLLTPLEQQNETRACEFDRDHLKRVTFENLITTWLKELNDGGMSLNEYRALRSRSDIGPDGDRHRKPQNIGFIDDLASTEEDVEDVEDVQLDEPENRYLAPRLPEKMYVSVPRLVHVPAPRALSCSADRSLLKEFVRMQCYRVRTKIERASEKPDRLRKFASEPGIEDQIRTNFANAIEKPLASVCQVRGGNSRDIAESIASEFVRPVFEEVRRIADAVVDEDYERYHAKLTKVLDCLDSEDSWGILTSLAF
jgi:HK97 family phage portal protein